MMEKVARDTSALYASQPGYQEHELGYIVDESAHLKKGTQSVGVARQYAGVVGKIRLC